MLQVSSHPQHNSQPSIARHEGPQAPIRTKLPSPIPPLPPRDPHSHVPARQPASEQAHELIAPPAPPAKVQHGSQAADHHKPDTTLDVPPGGCPTPQGLSEPMMMNPAHGVPSPSQGADSTHADSDNTKQSVSEKDAVEMEADDQYLPPAATKGPRGGKRAQGKGKKAGAATSKPAPVRKPPARASKTKAQAAGKLAGKPAAKAGHNKVCLVPFDTRELADMTSHSGCPKEGAPWKCLAWIDGYAGLDTSLVAKCQRSGQPARVTQIDPCSQQCSDSTSWPRQCSDNTSWPHREHAI